MKIKILKKIVRISQSMLIGSLLLAMSSICLSAETRSQESQAKLLKEARNEGRLSVYHAPTTPDIKKILDRFIQKYPFIKIDQYRAGSVALMNRILTEDRAKVKKWDVVIINTFLCQQLRKKGILQEYQSPERIAYEKGFRDEEGYWTGLFFNVAVLAYNTRMVAPKDIPQSFMDLLDPKWKGKMLMEYEPYQLLTGIEKEWGKERAWDFIKKLSKQEVMRRRGRSLLTQLCAAGEFPVAFPVYNYYVERLKNQGAPLDWVALDPATLSEQGISIAKTPVNPNAAKLFVDFSLSKEGQSLVRQFGRIPCRLEIKPDPPRLTEGIKTVPSDPNLGDEVARVLKEFNSIFKK